MDIASIIIFFIYVILILMILVYISPILSLLVLMLVPVASVYLLPDLTIVFFKQQEFSFVGISIQNLHILLLIWSAIIGVVASTEIVSWYLLKEEKPAPLVKKPEVPEKPAAASAPLKPGEAQKSEKPVAPSAPLKPGEAQKSVKTKVENLLLKLGKIMSGRKS